MLSMQAPFPPTYQPEHGYRQYMKDYVGYLNLYSTFLRASRRVHSRIPACRSSRQSQNVLGLCDLADRYGCVRPGDTAPRRSKIVHRDADTGDVRSPDVTIDSRDDYKFYFEIGDPPGPKQPDKKQSGGGVDSEEQRPHFEDKTRLESKTVDTERCTLHADPDCKVPLKADVAADTGISKNDVMLIMMGVGISPKDCLMYWNKYPLLHLLEPSYVMLIVSHHFGRRRDLRRYTDECIEKGIVKPAYVP